jgi:hypothetical protein
MSVMACVFSHAPHIFLTEWVGWCLLGSLKYLYVYGLQDTITDSNV